MKLACLLMFAVPAAAFVTRSSARQSVAFFSTKEKAKAGGMSEELGTPCEDDCAIDKYPNLPESVHPGVLSGKPMMDLLNHAKENGKFDV